MHASTSTLPCGCSTRDDEGLYCNADCGPPSCLDCHRYEGHCICDAALADILPDPMADGEDRVALIKEIGGDEFWREIFADDPDYYERHKAEIATMTQAQEHIERPFDVPRRPDWWAAPEDFYGTGEKRPAALTRDDGETLIYRNTLNWIGGLAGSGKSWVALMAALRSDRTFYWDFEDKPQTLGERATLLGGIDIVTDDTRFRYARGYNLLHDYGDGDQADRADFDAAVTWLGDGLLVIDTASSAGCPMDGGDVIPWIKEFVEPWKARGATIIVIDHLPKGKDRAPGPIGSQHKTAAPDGAVYSIDQRNAWGKSNGGRITLVLVKDRHGDVPAQVDRPVAIIRGGFDPHGGFGYTIDNPGAGDTTDTTGDDLDDRIVAAVYEYGANPDQPLTARRLREIIRCRPNRLTEATMRLHDEGRITRTATATGLRFTPPRDQPKPEQPHLTEAAL